MTLEVEFTVSNITKLRDELENALEAGPEAQMKLMNFVARSTQQRAKNRIRQGGRSGRIYRRYAPPRIVQASAPGEAPLNDTGALANNIRAKLATTTAMSGIIYVTSPYATVLEFGGMVNNGAYIAPRPYLFPSFQEAVRAAAGKFKEEFEALL